MIFLICACDYNDDDDGDVWGCCGDGVRSVWWWCDNDGDGVDVCGGDGVVRRFCGDLEGFYWWKRRERIVYTVDPTM